MAPWRPTWLKAAFPLTTEHPFATSLQMARSPASEPIIDRVFIIAEHDGEDIVQVSLWVNIVGFAGFDELNDAGPVFRAVRRLARYA
jgi:hypothetical protein